MKIPILIPLLAGALLLAGCGDSSPESSGSTAGGGLSTTVNEAAEAAKKTASDAATAANKAASDVAAAAKKTADEAMAAVNTQYQSLVDQAKKLIADGKASEAMASLRQLGSLKLTPEQKKVVDDLMAQAQKALAGGADAAKKTVDGLLKK